MKDNETKRSPALEALNDETLNNVTGGTVILASTAVEDADAAANDLAESLKSLTDAKKKNLLPNIGTSGSSDGSVMF